MNEQELGRIAWESHPDYDPQYDAWESLPQEARDLWIAVGKAVADAVQRDLQSQGFAAFVSLGGMALEQRIADLEKKQDRLVVVLNHNQFLLDHIDSLQKQLRSLKEEK
jgi:hypothetical protein